MPQKTVFFSILAHDLRGPFNSLLGLTEVLVVHPEEVDEERKKRFVNMIYFGMLNLANLIENLLDWSLSQKGTLNLELKEINLEKITKESVDLLSEIALAKQITVFTNINKQIILFADENMVKTILRNLISNALKFTRREGSVKVYSGREIFDKNKKLIEIIVEDNGIGISRKDQNKLFKIGSGFSTPGTEKEKGTGLGLVLIKEFVEKHGGTITVKSEKGIGTKIILTLPVLS